MKDEDSVPLGRTPSIREGTPSASPQGPWWTLRSESEELERRCSSAATTDASSMPPLAPLPEQLDECLPVVRRMAAQLKQKKRGRRAWPVAGGVGLFELAVSEKAQMRLLFVVDRMLRHCRDCGLEVGDDEALAKPAHLVADGHSFTFRLHESADKQQIEQTSAWRTQVAREPELHHWQRDRFSWTPTGVFTLVFRPLDVKTIVLTVRGKDDELLERLANVPAQLKRVARRLRVREELRAEVRAHQQVRATFGADKAKRKAAAHKKLVDYEAMAERLERAQRLRRLASALELNQHPATAEREWIRQAADWLDPTVEGVWSDMDD